MHKFVPYLTESASHICYVVYQLMAFRIMMAYFGKGLKLTNIL